MLLSIVIPMYNCQGYILHMLESLQKQGLEPGSYEIIIVDDGSTDNGPAEVRQFACEHPDVDVRLITVPNGGVCRARNEGYKYVRGEYLYMTDADDMLLPGALSYIIAQMQQRSADAALFFYHRKPEGYDISQHPAIDYDAVPVEEMNSHAFFRHFVNKMFFGCAIWQFVFRTEMVLRNNALFDPGLAPRDETPVIVHAIDDNAKVLKLDMAPYIYFQHSNSIMNNKSREHIHRKAYVYVRFMRHLCQCFDELRQRLGNPDDINFDAQQDYHTYFTITRVMAARLPNSEVRQILRQLKELGVYPYRKYPKNGGLGISKSHQRIWSWFRSPWRVMLTQYLLFWRRKPITKI